MTRKGFALILVLLFTAITLTILTGIASALASNVKLNRQAKNAYETHSLARGAIDAGISLLRSSTTKTYSLPTPTEPDCSSFKYKVFYKQPVGSTNAGSYAFDETTIKLDSINSFIAGQLQVGNDMRKDGFYMVRLCPVGTVDTVIGIGFLQGQKFTLEGKVTHDDTYICTYNNPLFPLITECGTGAAFACSDTAPYVSDCKYNHKKDKIKIYQSRS